jgi:SEL1 protein
LYDEAIKQLETIEKAHKNSNSINENPSYTDRLIHKALELLNSNAQIPSSTLDRHEQQHKFKTVTSMLEQSAREYQNNDALLLLAELNFVSLWNCKKYLLTLYVVLQIHAS